VIRWFWLSVAVAIAATAQTLAAGSVTAAERQPSQSRCFDDRITQLDRVISECTKMIRLGGRSCTELALAHNRRGHAYAATGSLDSAMTDFSKAVGHEPGFAEAYDNRGMIHAQKGNLTEALKYLSRAIKFEPR
jgi:tetratricopeptide (TPR) repeat protein